MALIRRQTLASLLWTCTATAVLGLAFDALPGYRNALGSVRTVKDLLVRDGPGLLCAVLHALCALRAGRAPPGRSWFVASCGAFDLLVGALMWVPFAGPFFAAFSPLGFVLLLAIYTPASILVGLRVAGLATLVAGCWILLESLAPRDGTSPRSAPP